MGLLFAATCIASSAATLAGKITDTSGAPVRSARVIIKTVAATTQNSNTFDRPEVKIPEVQGSPVEVTTSQSGEFEISNLSPGRYMLCFTPNDHIYIDFCASRTGGQYVEIADSNLALADLTAMMGSEIRITITPKNESSMPTHAFLVGGDGSFYPMKKEGRAGDFWVVVPPEHDWKLVTAIGNVTSFPSESIHSGGAGKLYEVAVTR